MDYFNPHSPGGERRVKFRCWVFLEKISIHTPREGSDWLFCWPALAAFNFNPHSPGGKRLQRPGGGAFVLQFQSTLPGRGATTNSRRWHTGAEISIHTPREGSDPTSSFRETFPVLFQSTLPGRGATKTYPYTDPETGNFNPHSPGGERQMDILSLYRQLNISIHTPREGSDLSLCFPGGTARNFNPHSPGGERP